MDEPKQTPDFHARICRMALSGISLATVIALVAALLFGLGSLFLLLEPVLLPVVLAGILAYLLAPCVAWVQRWVKRRTAAVLLVMTAAGLLLGGLGTAIVPPLVRQCGELVSARAEIFRNAVEAGQQQLNSNRFLQSGVDMLYERALNEAKQEGLPTVAEEVVAPEDYAGKLAVILNYHSDYLTEKTVAWLTAGSRALSGIGMLLIGTVMVPVFLFYFLKDSDSIIGSWHRLLPLREGRFRNELVETLQEINGYIVSFVRGQMLVSAADAVLLAVALKLLGLPYAITIAAVAALLGIIPYVGMISTWIPAMLIAWFTWHDVSHLLLVSAVFAAVSQLDGWVLQPKIVGNSVRMHDLTIMFSVLFWSFVIGGVVGALLAVPLTAVLKVLFTRYVWAPARSAAGEKV